MDEQKELEKLMDKIFEVDQLETPSTDFTSNVLEELKATKNTLAYTPLLPKWLFGVLAFMVALFVLYVFNSTDSITAQGNYFESFNLSTSSVTEHFLQLNFSRTLGYSVLAIGLLVCIQASLLNRFLGRTNSLA